MAHVVLVHGAWHAGWTWEKLVPLLEKAGHSVQALDLPGHERAEGAPASTTLKDYAEAVKRAAAAAPEGEVMLAGHSMGGAVVAQAAALGARVDKLAFVCGFAPEHGEVISVLNAGGESLLGQAMVEADERRVAITPEMARGVFYGECASEDAEAAVARLLPQPVQPFNDSFDDPDGKAKRPKRYGIVCGRDRTIDPLVQRQMYSREPFEKVWEIDADHSPFLSRPEELAAIFDEIAAA